MEHRDKTFEREDVRLDGNVFTGCTFKGCRVIFTGTQMGALSVCRFDNCDFQFHGPAQNTLEFLALLYKEGGDGGRKLVEHFFQIIRGAV
jgi:hypothetical protein